jgi:spore maturation protein CgeB
MCGGDVNERFFKIPAFGGFQICDDVSCIGDYFQIDTEIVVATDTADWYEKIKYYIAHPVERQAIVDAGRVRALRDHTYHSRAQQILDICIPK